MANRNRRIGSNDRFFPLSKRGWGARGILRLAQPFFVKHHVGSNARSRVELLPHRSICCVEIGRRSLVSWITIRSVDLSVDRVPRDPLSQGGPKKTVRSSFSPTFFDCSSQLSRSLRCRFAHFYRVECWMFGNSNFRVAVFCLMDRFESVEVEMKFVKKFPIQVFGNRIELEKRILKKCLSFIVMMRKFIL